MVNTSLSRIRCGVLVGLFFVLGIPGVLRAQDGLKVYEEQLRVRMDQQALDLRQREFDTGGWGTFGFFNFDDADNVNKTLRQYQLRLWAGANLSGVHRAYVRYLIGWDDWNSGQHSKGDSNECTLERAWYQMSVSGLMRQLSGEAPPFSLNVKVGRDFATIGSGLVLSMPLDMVQIEYLGSQWEAMGLLGKTVSFTKNIDPSERVYSQQDRCIFGGEVAYRGFSHDRPFAYILFNNDHSSPKGTDVFQSYGYDSRYVGIGSTGSLGIPNFRYVTELAYEWGRTYGSGVKDGSRDDICAMAYNLMVEYFFRVATRPRIMAEYIWGSGDSDRESSSLSTLGGNRPGTTDNAFNAFGFRDTGIAFAPEVSNLHIYVLGASFFPLESVRMFNELEVGTKAFIYNKSTSGPISDTSADATSRWVGWEWDIYADWRITSDLAWTIRYGFFQPGSAFSDRQCRQFLYTALTLSF